MSNRAELKQKFFDALAALGKSTVTKAEIKEIATSLGLASTQFFTKDEANRVGRGQYRVPSTAISMQAQVIQI